MDIKEEVNMLHKYDDEINQNDVLVVIDFKKAIAMLKKRINDN